MMRARKNTSFTTNALCVYMLFHAQAVASEQWPGVYAEKKNGFSEFSPPSIVSDHNHHPYDHKKHKQIWRSGSSLNEFNVKKYIQSHNDKYHDSTAYEHKKHTRSSRRQIRRNPWKLVKSRSAKLSFESKRPWGKLQERKPDRGRGIVGHDQRYKHWVNRFDSAYKYNPSVRGSGIYYSQFQYPGIRRNNYDGLIMGQALIHPLSHYRYQQADNFVPFNSNSPGYYFPGTTYYPFSQYTYPQLSHVMQGW